MKSFVWRVMPGGESTRRAGLGERQARETPLSHPEVSASLAAGVATCRQRYLRTTTILPLATSSWNQRRAVSFGTWSRWSGSMTNAVEVPA